MFYLKKMKQSVQTYDEEYAKILLVVQNFNIALKMLFEP